MTARLPDHLDLIATAPGGIQKLRGLILELAVRGKLVPQDAADEPAGELLKRVTSERAALATEGRGKSLKHLPAVENDDQAFALSAGWEWTRLGELVLNSGAGWSPSCEPRPRQGDEWGVLKVSAVSWGEFKPDENKALPENLAPRPEHEVAIGDFLISRANTAELVARSVVVESCPDRLMLSDKIVRLKLSQFVDGRFINITNACAQARDYYARVAGGTSSSMKNVSREQILNLVVPLPPLAEQHRIVAKVDELMALCDRLEAEQADANAAHARIIETLLGPLTQSADADELAANWQRLAEHFDSLFVTDAGIDALKEMVLQLAVMGRLVSQDLGDEPVSALLNRIRLESLTLGIGGRVKKLKQLPPVGNDKKDFKLPENWEWIRLQDIINVSSGNGLTSEQMVQEGDVPVFGGNGITGFHDQVNVDRPTLVIGRVGFYCGSVHLTPGKAWVTDNALKVRFSERSLSIKFLFWLLRATNLKGDESATAQPLVTGKGIYPIVVALPPLAEQHRIVAKVDELMALCDRLKADLVDARTRQARLADTLIDAALAAA
jgi:type I restriction enzyme, S subunit